MVDKLPTSTGARRISAINSMEGHQKWGEVLPPTSMFGSPTTPVDQVTPC